MFVVLSCMVATTDSSTFAISENRALVKTIFASLACVIDHILALTLLKGATQLLTILHFESDGMPKEFSSSWKWGSTTSPTPTTP